MIEAEEPQHLELAFVKAEISEEIRKTIAALISMAAGGGPVIIGGLLLIAVLVHGLNALGGAPIWMCYGIIGAIQITLAWELLSLIRESTVFRH